MSNPNGFDFTKFVPGFDFLKSLTPGGGGATSVTPGWVAPTLDPEELDKRIQELKTVHFWLEQNTKAVAATIQAMEVQRMTLATLKRMNMSFSDLAESLKIKPQSESESGMAAHDEEHATTAPKSTAKAAATAGGGIDPAHWWGALTDQFQHIAQSAMKEMTHHAAAHASSGTSTTGKAGASSDHKTGHPSKGHAPASTAHAKSVRKATVKTTAKTTTKPRAASRRAV